MENNAKKPKYEGLVTKLYLQEAVKRIATHRYYAYERDQENATMGRMCVSLFEKDYICHVRRNGRLSFRYPGFIVIPLKEKAVGADEPSPESRESDFDGKEWFEKVKNCRLVRRKNRFPLPVILYQGKYVCRSSTLHTKVTTAWYKTFGRGRWVTFSEYEMTLDTALYILMSVKFQEEMKNDVKLLKDFNIGYICDLRDSTLTKEGFEDNSTPENHYSYLYEENFKVIHLPYQAVTYFESSRDGTNNIESLVFGWNASCYDIEFKLPVDDGVKLPDIDFSKYKLWRVLQITQNYLLVLLNYITSGKKGILIHSSDGLDRTPLFISLIRLSLWADGLIHQSLNPMEMTFLTLAYDWYLCGHHMSKQVFYKYAVLPFCFGFLEYISSDRFSMKNVCDQSSKGESSQSNPATSEREEKLLAVQELFIELYADALEAIKIRDEEHVIEMREFVKRVREQYS